jgi:hypothetical protein
LQITSVAVDVNGDILSASVDRFEDSAFILWGKLP